MSLELDEPELSTSAALPELPSANGKSPRLGKREPLSLLWEGVETVWRPVERVTLVRSKPSSELELVRGADPVGDGVMRGGPAGVALAQARMMARLGEPCSSELSEGSS